MKTIYILFYLMNYHFLYFYKLIIILNLIKHLIKKDNNCENFIKIKFLIKF